jgi:hypothetical protein
MGYSVVSQELPTKIKANIIHQVELQQRAHSLQLAAGTFKNPKLQAPNYKQISNPNIQ